MRMETRAWREWSSRIGRRWGQRRNHVGTIVQHITTGEYCHGCRPPSRRRPSSAVSFSWSPSLSLLRFGRSVGVLGVHRVIVGCEARVSWRYFLTFTQYLRMMVHTSYTLPSIIHSLAARQAESESWNGNPYQSSVSFSLSQVPGHVQCVIYHPPRFFLLFLPGSLVPLYIWKSFNVSVLYSTST